MRHALLFCSGSERRPRGAAITDAGSTEKSTGLQREWRCVDAAPVRLSIVSHEYPARDIGF